MEEEKTIDVVVQEYEQKLQQQKEDYEKKLAEQQENHNQEIRAIISGRKNPKDVGKPEKEEPEKDFFTTEIEKTEKLLKIKK